MKGIIVMALKGTVVDNFGYEAWQKSLKRAGLPPHSNFRSTVDVPDETVVRVLEAVCAELNITLDQAGEAFGHYWMHKIVPRVYPVFTYNIKSARQLLLKMDKIHDMVTRTIANARPPRFEYSWTDDNTLIMTYNSPRGLIFLLPGLIRGVGKYFEEELNVRKLNNTEIEVIFPPEKETT
ncbi:heme NO-binding domain-containing protein [bacterium]|nr:heme NO-binding domain-containing protein [bacterium]